MVHFWGLREGQKYPLFGPPGRGAPGGPPGGPRAPPGGARRAPGAEIWSPRNHPFLSEKPTSVPTGRVIKYPRKCTPGAPGAPRGPPGGPPAQGGLGPPPGGASQGVPGTPNLPSLGTPYRGGLGPPPGGGVPGGIDTLPDWRGDLAVQRYWETRDNGPQGARKMACGQVRAHQVVPTRELGPDWAGAIPTGGGQGPPRVRVRRPSTARGQ